MFSPVSDSDPTTLTTPNSSYGIASAKTFLRPAAGELSASARRCIDQYALDRNSDEPLRVVQAGELSWARDSLGSLIEQAQDELDRLYEVIKPAGYVVLLCDDKGTVIEHRVNHDPTGQLEAWAVGLGAVWSEHVEGTNAIGTCIVERRPVTVHQVQHFRTSHARLSGSAAPIFGGDGELIAVLAVWCTDPELSERSHALAGSLAVASARVIEERLFRDRFRREWVVALAPAGVPDAAMLVAVDRDQRIIGADRNARAALSIGEMDSLWSIYDRDLMPFRRKDSSDIQTRWVRTGTGEAHQALITPPESAFGISRNPTMTGLHTRSRICVLRSQREQPGPLARGGVAPQALRRVQEYVEANLERNIDLQTLAAQAELSVYHFARAFKQSTGLTPHSYLLQRRAARAQQLLLGTDLPLSEISLQTGFADHSHFARQFRRLTGMSPSEVRRNQRQRQRPEDAYISGQRSTAAPHRRVASDRIDSRYSYPPVRPAMRYPAAVGA